MLFKYNNLEGFIIKRTHYQNLWKDLEVPENI